jgi:hypothetical protein
MAYMTITNWTVTDEMNDEMVAAANEKFVPLIMSVGASSVHMVRTGDTSLSVVTQYPDAAAATAAQEKIAGIRAEAASDFPMTMDSANGGEVIAGS